MDTIHQLSPQAFQAEMLVKDEGVVMAEKARMVIVQGANGDKNNSNIGDAKTNVTDSEVEVAKDDGKSVKDLPAQEVNIANIPRGEKS